jgi:hypothetical protein
MCVIIDERKRKIIIVNVARLIVSKIKKRDVPDDLQMEIGSILETELQVKEQIIFDPASLNGFSELFKEYGILRDDFEPGLKIKIDLTKPELVTHSSTHRPKKTVYIHKSTLDHDTKSLV